MHSWVVFVLFAAGFLICALLAVVRRLEEPSRSRMAAVLAVALAIPALVVLALILKDGSRAATTSELLVVAIYTGLLSVVSSFLAKRRERRAR